MTTHDDALAVLHALVLDDGRRWGEAATDWQRADAEAILDVDGAPYSFLTRPRGGSKTTDVAAVMLAILLEQAPPGSRSYWLAVDADQADLGVAAMRGFVARTEGLGSALKVMSRQVVNMRTQAAVEVLPADGASAFGLLPYVAVVDEVAAWPNTRTHSLLWEAIVSAMPKTRGRLVCLTSAGDPSHWSFRVLEGAKGSERWRVSEVPGPLPWRDPADLAEQARMLPESSYARYHLNRWAAAEDRLTTIEAVRDCIGHEGTLPAVAGVEYVLALDIGLTNDRTVLATGHREVFDERSHGVVLDRMDVWQGRKGEPVDLTEVAEVIAEVSGQYNRARLVFDPYQGVHLAQTLRVRGVKCTPFTFSASSTGRLGLLLFRLLRDGLLDLPADEDLVTELASVTLRENTPGSYRLDNPPGTHDDRAVALALLSHELLERRSKRRRSIASVTMAGED